MASLLDYLRPQQAQQPGAMQQQGGGLLAQLLDQSVALPMAGALLGNQGNAANFGNAFSAAAPALAQRKLEAQTNKTGDWLRQQDQRYGDMLDNGFQPREVYDLYLQERKAQKPQGTSQMQEYEFAKSQGYGGSFMDYQMDQRKAGATSVNVTNGGGRYGTIPQGYELIEGPNGASMRAIPGGPEDTSAKDARSAGQAGVASRVVTTAADRARKAAEGRSLGAFGQSVAQHIPWTESAEVARQVEVLKSQAKVENLTAMRQASPTGGALGAVSDKEAEMLAAKSGALDANSPNFQRDLDDYELTLLQVVHGPEEGARIFMQSRGGLPQGVPQAGGGNRTQSGVTWSIER